MRKIIIGGRRTGKTMFLIKYSFATRVPICVYTEQEAGTIKELANKLGVDIPDPIVITRAFRNTYVGRNIRQVVVDDGDFILESLLSRFLEIPGLKVDLFTAEIDGAMLTDLGLERPTFDPKGLDILRERAEFLSQIHAKPVENNDQNDAKID